MIDADGLVRRFGDVVAVDGVSLRVPDGTILALLGPNGAGKTTIVRVLTGVLALFELTTHEREPMVGFSKGMKQKVALARALLHEPAALFLDEPTAGLDPLAARTVRELIVGLKHASRSIVLCTHDLDEAERLADRVAILAHGRIVASDSAAALRANASHETLVQILLAGPCPAAVTIAERSRGVSDPVLAESPQG